MCLPPRALDGNHRRAPRRPARQLGERRARVSASRPPHPIHGYRAGARTRKRTAPAGAGGAALDGLGATCAPAACIDVTAKLELQAHPITGGRSERFILSRRCDQTTTVAEALTEITGACCVQVVNPLRRNRHAPLDHLRLEHSQAGPRSAIRARPAYCRPPWVSRSVAGRGRMAVCAAGWSGGLPAASCPGRAAGVRLACRCEGSSSHPVRAAGSGPDLASGKARPGRMSCWSRSTRPR